MQNYKRQMLDYAIAFPNVDKEYWQNGHSSFYESIEHLQRFTSANLPPIREEEFWRKYLQEVKDHVEKLKKIRQGGDDNQPQKFYCFLTINYDDTTSVNIDVMHQIAQRVCKLQYVVMAVYCHEKFRKEQGIHHHTHFLITTTKYIPASKFIEPIFKMAIVKTYVGQKNFIDCSVSGSKKNNVHAYEDYLKYIHGDKKEEKMHYVAKDRAWRIEHDYEHYYEHKKS